MTKRPPTEFWTNLGSARHADPAALAASAVKLEAEGWDGGWTVDSQNIAADPYVSLALVASATKTFKFMTGVTNPITRHPAVTAGAIASLQVLSRGRAVLGIGRGDSSLAYLGASPMPVKAFEDHVQMIQTYLRGEGVSWEALAPTIKGAELGYGKLALGKMPEGGSRLTWLPEGLPKVPVDVAATGPKVISIGARVADRLTFALGAVTNRLQWAIDTARQAAEAIQRDPAELRFGAYIMVFPHTDKATARNMARGLVASGARFSIMNRKVVGPVTDHQRQVLERLADSYDMNAHGKHGGEHGNVIDDRFVDEFAVVGTPGECVERVQELIAMGIDRPVIYSGMKDQEGGAESYQMLLEEVMPALRR